jgi:hypothetical protein
MHLHAVLADLDLLSAALRVTILAVVHANVAARDYYLTRLTMIAAPFDYLFCTLVFFCDPVCVLPLMVLDDAVSL